MTFAEKQRHKKVMPVSPGRPKGVPNKNTTILKDALLIAAEQAGGQAGLVGYLKTQATENPGPFMALLGKVLPMQVAGADGGAIRLLHTIERRIVKPGDPDR